MVFVKVNVTESSPTEVQFEVSGIGYPLANAIRRVVTGSLPCFAIDKVTFYENSSAMFDEYVAHRLGLVPIMTPKGYTKDDEIVFSLNSEGPGTVYSKELKSSDKEVKVANDKIPIMKLAEGQKIRADCKAVMGVGTTSAKFQPFLASYKTDDDTSFEFYVESFGQMPAPEALRRALDIINSELKEIAKEMKK